MPVLTITSRKGGCGKTTLCTALAAALAAEGEDVALLDTDPNGTASRWASTIHEGPVIRSYSEADAERLADLLPALADRHRVLLVDTAGFGNQAATVATAGADAVLVPATPGEGDITEAQRTVAFVDGLGRSTRRQIPVRVVANRIRRGTTLSRHLLEELERLELPRLETAMSEAVSFGELGFGAGLARAAADETAALLAELRTLTWLPAKMDIRQVVKA